MSHYYHDETCPADRKWPRWANTDCTCKSEQHLNTNPTAAALSYLREQFGEGWRVSVTKHEEYDYWISAANFHGPHITWRAQVLQVGDDPMSAARACVEARDAAGFTLPLCHHCGERRLYRSMYTPPGSHATFGKNPPNTRCAYCDDWLGWADERSHADRLAEALRNAVPGECACQTDCVPTCETCSALAAHDERRGK